MADIKINGNVYNDIERIRVASADGLGAVQFSDASVLDGLIADTEINEYYNSNATAIVSPYVFKFAKITGVINMPNVKTIAYQAFQGCSATEIRFPSLQTLTNGSNFLVMGNLVKAVFGKSLVTLQAQTFNGCAKLATLVLPYEGVVAMLADAIKSTAIANGTGYVYVPSAYVDSYKADTNWSTYADQIRAIEDYPDEVV